MSFAQEAHVGQWDVRLDVGSDMGGQGWMRVMLRQHCQHSISPNHYTNILVLVILSAKENHISSVLPVDTTNIETNSS